MSNTKTKLWILFGLIPLIVGGCYLQDLDKVKGGEIYPKLTLPIANSTFGLVEFLEKNETAADYVGVDDRGVIFFQYEDSIATPGIDDDIQIPDQVFQEFFSLNLAQVNLINASRGTPGYEFTTPPIVYDFTVDSDDGDELDSLLTNGGILRVVLNADFPADGELDIRFPGITENGVVVERNYPLNYNGITSLNVNDIIDFDGLKIDFTNGGTTVNDFKFEIVLTLNDITEDVSVANSLSMSVQFEDLEIGSLFGKIGTRTVDSDPAIIDLEVFQNLNSGNLFLDEPSITLSIINSFGIPSVVDLKIRGIQDGDTVDLSELPPFQIGAPTIEQIGESVTSSETIDETNSNLPQFLSSLPSKLEVDFDAVLNPSGATSQNFVLDESEIDVQLRLEVPLVGRFQELIASDTVDFNGEDILQDLESILVQTRTINELPFDLDLQIFFIDAQGNVVDQLFDNGSQLLISGEVDDNGDVISSSESVLRTTINEAKAERLENAVSAIISTSISTFNNGAQSVKITESQQVTIKLGIEAVLKLDI